MLPVSCCADASDASASVAVRAAAHARARQGFRGGCAFIVRNLLTLAPPAAHLQGEQRECHANAKRREVNRGIREDEARNATDCEREGGSANLEFRRSKRQSGAPDSARYAG